MAELRSRRSERLKAARDQEEEEIKESAVSDNDAEDADEDSEGPGSNPGRARRMSPPHTTRIARHAPQL